MRRKKHRQQSAGTLQQLRANIAQDNAIYLFISACMLFGGGPGELGVSFVVIALAGLYVLLSSIWKGNLQRFAQLPLLVRLAVSFSIALPLMQLIPLPPGLWQALPGHELRAEILSSLRAADIWLPLSITPAETAYSAVMALSVFGLFLSILGIPTDRIRSVLLWVSALIGLGVLVGLIQVFTAGKALQFHPVMHRDALVGFFANKNHMGLLLACAIPLMYVLAEKRIVASNAAGLFLAVGFVAIVGLLVATNSRAGLALGVLAITLVALRRFSAHRLRVVGFAGGVIVASILIASFVPVVDDLLSRVGTAQDDARVDFLDRGAPLIEQYGVVGSGLGSFTYVYAPTERLDWVTGAYLNHLHNDYLQLVIEGGIAGALAMALWLGALMQAAMRLKMQASGKDVYQDEVRVFAWLGAVIIALFLAHSLVDYPFRRMGTLAILTIATAIFLFPLLPRISTARSS
ncbi:MAG: O-antigen ligase family protein [Blastomonas sp.]|uniref:O-antigen ligase family protein n=1 Tax=Blastomonas sp. TaxID=1909299 RepID=UPI00406A8B59|nr:O-antigen ligase family protein [Blastomonas sp.]